MKKNGKLQRIIEIQCVILALILLSLTSCNRKERIKIDTFSYPSPDGKTIAIRVGPERKGYPDSPPKLDECKLVLLELEGVSLKQYHSIETQKYVYVDMAWNPLDTSQLYFATMNKINPFKSEGERPEGELIRLTLKNEGYSLETMSQFNKYPNISSAFSWSPDGSILSGQAIDWPHIVPHGKLAVSYDNGQNIKLTDISTFHGTPVWISNDELYVRQDGETILRVLRDRQKFIIAEKFVESKEAIYLCGSIKGQLVYRTKDTVFVGEKAILNSKHTLRLVKADKYILAESDGKIVIFNDDLKLYYERVLNKQTHLLNFCSKTNIVFLVENWETILCYDFTAEETPHVLFSVDMFNE